MTQTPESESARKKSRRTPSRCSMFQLERANHCNYTDQAGSPVVCRNLCTGQYGWSLSQGQQADWFTLSETANVTFGRTQRLLRLLRHPTFVVFLLCFFNWILFLWGICDTTKTFYRRRQIGRASCSIEIEFCMGWRRPIFHFHQFLVVKWCRRSKNENYAKKERNCFTPSF